MSRTLHFFNCLVAQGRHLQQLGLAREALGHWNRLAKMKSLPTAVAEEAQNRLGELQMQRERYARAGRHFSAALAHQPDNAHYHYLLAQAIEEDPKGKAETALEHYERALQLDPDQPAYLAGFGRLAVELDREAEGLTALRRAAELSPDDPDVMLTVVDGLGTILPEEAERLLRFSLFRNPRDSRFRKLWSDFQFQRVVAEQEMSKKPFPSNEGATCLPFAPVTDAAKTPPGWRRHPAGRSAGPHFPMQTADKKHA